MVILHKIHGKDFLVEVANNSEVERLSDNFENEPKSPEVKEEKRDTFEEELKKLESKMKSGNDYMSMYEHILSMAKEGRCKGDQKTSFRSVRDSPMESLLECKVPTSNIPRT